MPKLKTEEEMRQELIAIDKDLDTARKKLNDGEVSRDWFVRRYESLNGMKLGLRWALGENDRYD